MMKKWTFFLITVFFLIIFGVVLLFQQNNIGELLHSSKNNEVNWMFDYDTKTWQVKGFPPVCPKPLELPSPVNINLASGILYPGQERGGDYKSHGGFRFDNRDSNEVEVRAIMDGVILKASRYLEAGEEQTLLFYVNDCGFMVRYDHLLTLSSKLKTVLKKVPLGKEGDSRTTNIEPKVYVKKGEVLATEVGFRNYNGKRNVTMDFGLYDLRTTNGVHYDASFRSRFPMMDEYETHAVCWLDYLEQLDKNIVRNLPGADGKNGTISDYCK